MKKYNENNERIKRKYLTFLKQAKGQNEASIDSVADIDEVRRRELNPRPLIRCPRLYMLSSVFSFSPLQPDWQGVSAMLANLMTL